jgi:hypothetical protein
MGGLNKQWLGIFKTLPLGVIVSQPGQKLQKFKTKTKNNGE